MGVLKKAYELSIWQDIQIEQKDTTTNIITYTMEEERVAIIGSHKMKSQNKALEPKLTRNINGNVTFTFSMFTEYLDNITGVTKRNPYVDLLHNETKLKLLYDENWYDLIVKKIEEKSAENKNLYTAISQHINELSKNGFNVELSDNLHNNVDNIFNLSRRILEETDWYVDEENSDVSVETREESLIPLITTTEIMAIRIDDSAIDNGGTLSWARNYNSYGYEGSVRIPANSLIWAFYSSCSSCPNLFQFYYFYEVDENNQKISYTYKQLLERIVINENRIIQDRGHQYCIILDNDGVRNAYTNELPEYGFKIPQNFNYNPQLEDPNNPNDRYEYILSKVRGSRYVCAEISSYNHKLQQTLYKCVRKDEMIANVGKTIETIPQYWYTKTKESFKPELMPNFAGNTNFTSSTGWQANVLFKESLIVDEPDDIEKPIPKKYWGTCEPGSETLFSQADEENWNEELSFKPYLHYQNVPKPPYWFDDITLQCLVCNGPHANKDQIKSYSKGESYLILFKVFDEESISNLNNATIELASHPYDAAGCYALVEEDSESGRLKSKVLTKTSDNCVRGVKLQQLTRDNQFGITENVHQYFFAELKIQENISEKQMQDHCFQLFMYLDGAGYLATGKASVNIEEFYFIKTLDKIIYNVQQSKFIRQIFTPLIPISELANNLMFTSYKYYSNESIENLNSGELTVQELTPLYTSFSGPLTQRQIELADNAVDKYIFETRFNQQGYKIRRVELNDSNYFNGISTLSETFSQWPQFVIERSSLTPGKIISKKLRFKNYTGDETTTGFRPGINLQGITRKINSEKITTKMIVKPNNNSVAENGYCAIADAYANETGENTLYDFSYYINKHLINKDKLQYLLYNIGEHNGEVINGKLTAVTRFNSMFGEDITEFYPNITPLPEDPKWSCQNLFPRLKILNIKIAETRQNIRTLSQQLLELKSQLSTHQKIVNESIEGQEEAVKNFESLSKVDFPFPGIKSLGEEAKEVSRVIDGKIQLVPITYEEMIASSTSLQKYFRDWIQYHSNVVGSQEIVNRLFPQVAEFESDINTQSNNQKRWTEYKQQLSLSFFKLYGRFIQEGTWIDEKYSDPELYYTDALSTLYTSAKPQIQYTINVASIGSLPGYEHNNFKLGDKSYVEDESFFGYNEEGFPYREEVILTEITNSLDDLSKDVIKVQNYKTQFEDLFQRITASVQQTKFLEGAYQKAVRRTSEESDDAIQFLETALGDENFELKNRGSQSIKWNDEGLIITDDYCPSKRLRLIGGQILYNYVKANGDSIWKTLLSTDGLSAAKLTAGTINTDNIEIASDGSPTFVLNKYGLTAYDWIYDNLSQIQIKDSKGVRFDKFGIYGYNSNESKEFLPESKLQKLYGNPTLEQSSKYISEHQDVNFYLGWSGLRIFEKTNLNESDDLNGIIVHLGVHEQNNSDQKLLFSILQQIHNQDQSITTSPLLTVDNSGNLYMKGSITATSGFIGGENGWKINDQCIWLGNDIASPEIYLGTKTISASIGSQTRRNIILKVGGNFAVNRNGEMYCTNGEFSGTLRTGAGNIGPFNINEYGLIAAAENGRPYCGILGSDHAYSYNEQKIIFCAGTPTNSFTESQIYPTFYFDFSNQKNIIDSGSSGMGGVHLGPFNTSVNIYPLVGPEKGYLLYSQTITPNWQTLQCDVDEVTNGLMMRATTNFIALAKEITIRWDPTQEGKIVMRYVPVSKYEWTQNSISYRNYFGINTEASPNDDLDYSAYQDRIKTVIRDSNYKPYIVFKGPINYPPFLITEDGDIQGKVRQELDAMHSATDKLSSGINLTMQYKGVYDDNVYQMVFSNGILISHEIYKKI